MRRRAAALVALASPLLAATVTHVAASAGGTPAYRTYPAFVQVADGPGGHHRVRLDTTLYVPRTATATHPEPAVLATNGFGGAKTDQDVAGNADFLARHGYVVLAYTSQGFGASGGCITLDSADYDVKDVSQLISKVLAPRRDVLHDRSGTVVGMVGGSYGGGITLLAAEHDARIRAIVPGRTWNSLQYALFPDNVVTRTDPTGFTHQLVSTGVFKAEWTSLFFADGNAQPAQGHGGCPQDKAASGDPTSVAGLPCPGFPAVLCEAYARVATTGDTDPATLALLAESSGATYISHLRVPTLIIQGESDTLFNENDAVATYLALRRRHVPVAMIWNNGGHGGYPSQPGEGDVYGGAVDLDHGYDSLRTLAWFDHWLKHRPVPTGPAFAYFRGWVPFSGRGPDTVQYGTAARYPAAPMVRFGLAGGYAAGGQLAPPGYPVTSSVDTFVRPPGPGAYSETSNCTGPQSGAPCPGPAFGQVGSWDSPAQYVQFTSPAFVRPVVVVGVPLAHVHITHMNGQDLIFFAKLYDVAPDGTATLVNRLVAPVRVPNGWLTRAVNFHLLGVAHQFAAGHRVRLVLAATDATSTVGASTNAPDYITVTTGAPPGYSDQYELGGPDPSWLELPVLDPAAVSPGG